jgi:hypothetical protein
MNQLLDVEESELPLTVGGVQVHRSISVESLGAPASVDGIYSEAIREVSLGQGSDTSAPASLPQVGEERLPEGEEGGHPAVDACLEVVGRAREALADGRPRDALEALAGISPECPDQDYESVRADAIETHVRAERERAASLFLEAREKTGPERRAAFEEVKALLEELLANWPENAYAAAIGKNIRKVDQELSRLPASD